jgi:hypothetical protein
VSDHPGRTASSHPVAKFAKYPSVYPTGLNLLLDFEQLSTGLPQLEIQPPKSVAWSQEFDGNPERSAFLGGTYANNTRLSYLAREKLCQLELTADPRVTLHLQ